VKCSKPASGFIQERILYVQRKTSKENGGKRRSEPRTPTTSGSKLGKKFTLPSESHK